MRDAGCRRDAGGVQRAAEALAEPRGAPHGPLPGRLPEFDSNFEALGLGGTFRGHDGMVKVIGAFEEAWEQRESLPALIPDMGDRALVLGTFRLPGSASGLEFERELARRKRHESGGAGYRRHDELVEVVEHGAGEELAERSGVALVGAPQRREVARAVAFVDDRRRVAKPPKVFEQRPSISTEHSAAREQQASERRGGLIHSQAFLRMM